MISETSYSENGQPAVVERKSMSYSTDPSDLVDIDLNCKTSTIERKNSRGGIYSVTKIEKFQKNSNNKAQAIATSTPTPKVIRRGSVKELKEKFIKKDSSSSVSTKTETTKTEDEIESCHISGSAESKSFLNSEKKASNVQEVITYMRNADNG